MADEHVDALLDALRHPRPTPLDVEGAATGEEQAGRTGGFMDEARLMEVYGRLGSILHAENPMGRETDYGAFTSAVPNWVSEVANLLECHKVHLYHRPEEFYVIKMFGDVDGDLLCIRFETTAEGQAKCAWPDCVSSSMRLYCEYLGRPWTGCRLPETEPAQMKAKTLAREIDGAPAGEGHHEDSGQHPIE